jgi:hypothetical protein
MMPFQLPIVGENPGRGEQYGCAAERARRAAEQNGGEGDAQMAEVSAQLPVLMEDAAGLELDSVQSYDIMAAIRNQRPYLFHHLAAEIVGARTEAYHHAFRILAEQLKEADLQLLFHLAVTPAMVCR